MTVASANSTLRLVRPGVVGTRSFLKVVAREKAAVFGFATFRAVAGVRQALANREI